MPAREKEKKCIVVTVVTSSRETEDHHLPLPGNAILIGNVIEAVPCTTRHRTPQVRPGAPLGLRGQLDAKAAVSSIGRQPHDV